MTPYKTGAPVYGAVGYTGIFPVNGKLPALKNVTGREGIQTTPNQYAAAGPLREHAQRNIGWRLPDGVVGIDVDTYDTKTGNATLERLTALCGPLPGTWTSTSRGAGQPSRIHFYRVPEGTKLQGVASARHENGTVTADIEIIQHHHRYAVVWPSVHPGHGGIYRWYDVVGDEAEEPPTLDALPELPGPWLEYLRAAETPVSRGNGATEGEFLDQHTGARDPGAMGSILRSFTGVAGSRHDTMFKALHWAAREAAAGVFTAEQAFTALRAEWDTATSGEGRAAEFDAMLAEACGSVSDTDVERTRARQAVRTAGPAEFDVAMPLEVDPEGKPVIDVTDPVAAMEWLREEIGSGQLSCIFRRSDGLVHTPRIGEDGYKPFDESATATNSPAQVQRISESGIKALIEHRYGVTKLVSKAGSGDEGKGQPKKRTGAFFPGQALASVVNSAILGEGAPNLRALAGVTHTPLMRADGSILDTPGYDPSTGLLYLPEPGLTVPAVPDRPTAEQIQRAVKVILTPVEEFDFVTDHHRANWVGLMMTPVLRPLLPPPYQCGVMTAPRRGSGKTMLAELQMRVHGGQTRTAPNQDQARLHDEILAILATTTAPVVTFDNIRGKFGGTTLEKLFTDREYTGRKLGETLNVTVPNDRLWLATSNNATIGGDMDRRIRIVKIRPRLNPGSDRPEDFVFERNPLTWITKHRGEYLAALLTVARGWVLAGSPREAVRSDFFKDWVESLRGMLVWAGFPGKFAGEDVTEDVTDEDSEEWSGFLAEAHEAFGNDQFTVADVLRKATTPAKNSNAWSNDVDTEFNPTCLPAEFLRQYGKDLTTPAAKSSLAKFFGYRLDTSMGGYSLERTYKSESGKRPARYRINKHGG